MKKNSLRFKGTYRAESDRLQGWDYSDSAWYFITICAHNKEPFFGEIIDEEMRLSSLGVIVVEEWKRTERIHSHVVHDEYVIMPNHFHAIIQIARMHHPKMDPVETPRRTSRMLLAGLGRLSNGASAMEIRLSRCHNQPIQRQMHKTHTLLGPF